MDQAKQKSEPALNDIELHEGDSLTGVFICTGKRVVRSAITGKPYLAIDLRDRRGIVPARAFRDPYELAERFEPGGLVEVCGIVRRYRDDLQLHLAWIRAVAGDPTSLLPHTYRHLEELDGFLEQLAREVGDPQLAALLERILTDDELRVAWRRAPCAPQRHYGFCGGALEHSVAVATLAQTLGETHLRLDRDLLVTAALLHELGRAEEFEYGIEFRLTSRARLFGHAQLAADLIAGRSEGVLAPGRQQALQHCILFAAGAAMGEADRHPKRRPLAEAVALRELCTLDTQVKGAFEARPIAADPTEAPPARPSERAAPATPAGV